MPSCTGNTVEFNFLRVMGDQICLEGKLSALALDSEGGGFSAAAHDFLLQSVCRNVQIPFMTSNSVDVQREEANFQTLPCGFRRWVAF